VAIGSCLHLQAVQSHKSPKYCKINHMYAGCWASFEVGQIAQHASCHSLKLYAQERHGSDACMGYGLRSRGGRIHNGILHVSFSKLYLLRLGSQHECHFTYQIQVLTVRTQIPAHYPGLFTISNSIAETFWKHN
jgi:hypothetical protein